MRNQVLGLLVLAAMVAGSAAEAQPAQAEYSARRALSLFERASLGQEPSGFRMASQIIAGAARSPSARADSVLDGLQRMAIGADDERVRTNALSFLAGAANRTSANPVPGVPVRLAAIYEMAESPLLRAEAVTKLGFQANRVEAVRLLRAIAVQDSARQRAPSAAHDALYALTYLGADGEATLRDLFSRGAVRERKAREAIAALARERGWRR